VQSEVDSRSVVSNYNIDASRVSVVPNDIPLDRIHHTWINDSLPAQPHSLLFVAAPYSLYRKGWPLVRSAIARVPEIAPSVRRLGLVGVSAKEIHSLKTEAGSVELEIVAHERTGDLPSLMAQYHLLLMPSAWDPCPNLLLEALGMGLPVLGSNTAGIATMLREQRLLFTNGDIDDFLDSLSDIATHDGYAWARYAVRLRRQEFLFDWDQLYIHTLGTIFQ
jgi:glycosyltransferase involved in cell wall biosynthesis